MTTPIDNDTTVSTSEVRTERELVTECKRRAKALAEAERELKGLRNDLPALVAQHGEQLDRLREHETLVYHELKAVESPKQGATFIEPLWRKENPAANAVLNQHEKLTKQARELEQEIDAKRSRAYQLEQMDLPRMRGWVQEADDLLATYKAQVQEAVERERKGESQPLGFDQLRKRILGKD